MSENPKYQYQFHTLIVLSTDPLARRPSPSKLTLFTQSTCLIRPGVVRIVGSRALEQAVRAVAALFEKH